MDLDKLVTLSVTVALLGILVFCSTTIKGCYETNKAVIEKCLEKYDPPMCNYLRMK